MWGCGLCNAVNENVIGASKMQNNFLCTIKLVHFPILQYQQLQERLLHDRASNQEKKQRTNTKNEVKKIRRDNFIRGNREKSNIAITILEKKKI